MTHDDIQRTLQEMLPKYEITVKPVIDGLYTVMGAHGEKRRTVYVEAAMSDNEAYLQGRADLLSGKKTKEE